MIERILNGIRGIVENMVRGEVLKEIGGWVVKGMGGLVKRVCLGGLKKVLGMGGKGKEVEGGIEGVREGKEVVERWIEDVRERMKEREGRKSVGG